MHTMKPYQLTGIERGQATVRARSTGVELGTVTSDGRRRFTFPGMGRVSVTVWWAHVAGARYPLGPFMSRQGAAAAVWYATETTTRAVTGS